MIKTINIAKDFSAYPSGRVDADGPYNGTRFRNEFLLPALNGNDKVVIILDGLRSYGSSFFEEAFGGLLRLHDFSVEQLKSVIDLRATSDTSKFYRESVMSYMAQRA